MSKVIVPNLKFDPNEFELEGEIVDDVKQKCLDGSIFEYYLVKTKYGINKYIKEEIKPNERRWEELILDSYSNCCSLFSLYGSCFTLERTKMWITKAKVIMKLDKPKQRWVI